MKFLLIMLSLFSLNSFAKPAESTMAERNKQPTVASAAVSFQKAVGCPESMPIVDCYGWFTEKLEDKALSTSFYPDAATKATLGKISGCDTKQTPSVFNACVAKGKSKVSELNPCAREINLDKFMACMKFSKPKSPLQKAEASVPAPASSGDSATP